MSKRDIKAPSISQYYRVLASSLPESLENRQELYEAYMKYINKIEKEDGKALVNFKRKSYAKKKFK